MHSSRSFSSASLQAGQGAGGAMCACRYACSRGRGSSRRRAGPAMRQARGHGNVLAGAGRTHRCSSRLYRSARARCASCCARSLSSCSFMPRAIPAATPSPCWGSRGAREIARTLGRGATVQAPSSSPGPAGQQAARHAADAAAAAGLNATFSKPAQPLRCRLLSPQCSSWPARRTAPAVPPTRQSAPAPRAARRAAAPGWPPA